MWLLDDDSLMNHMGERKPRMNQEDLKREDQQPEEDQEEDTSVMIAKVNI